MGIFIVALVIIIIIILYAVNKSDSSKMDYPDSPDDPAIILSGRQGEIFAENQLSMLTDDYTVISNKRISFDGKTSEIDNIVIGKSGVFIVEIKNYKGYIIGDYSDKEWIQNKIGRAGTPYSREFYSPVKQVGTHIYRLAQYLRDNGIKTYINGAVYFVNPQSNVTVYGESNGIPVFSYNENQGRDLLTYILNGNECLSEKKINEIINLLNYE